MTKYLLLECAPENVEVISAFVWEIQGILAVTELEDRTRLFHQSPRELEVLEFGSEASQKWADFVSQNSSSSSVFLRVDHDRSGKLQKPLSLALKGCQADWKCLGEFVDEDDVDYQKVFRDNFNGFAVGERLWVGAPWGEIPKNRIPIFVEPGMAFGTGDHATTQLCLEWLGRQEKAPKRVFDLGAGTGILAVACKKLFPETQVVASDLDPACRVEIAKTLKLNSLASSEIEVVIGAKEQEEAFQRFENSCDWVLSNIYSEVLRGLAKDVERILIPRGVWMCSGFVEGESTEKFCQEISSSFSLLSRSSQKQSELSLDSTQGLKPKETSWLRLEFSKL